uniref:Receptor protein-tyrosine kinase n=1 Tax=Rhabditophanes sp. KR3021 TaxID=114890 RepID=A0AC35UAI5_9BILA
MGRAGDILPQLKVISGQSLTFNYALIVFSSKSLTTLEFTHLTLIRNGGVRITKNINICFVKTIDWKQIVVGEIDDVLVEESLLTCPYTCNQQNNSECHVVSDLRKCWGNTSCQIKCDHIIDNVTKKLGPGCDPDGNRCHEECVGGCSKANNPGYCYSCKTVSNDDICVSKCPSGRYNYMNARCVTEQRCREMPPDVNQASGMQITVFYKPFKGECLITCPQGHEEIMKDGQFICVECDKGKCIRKCRGQISSKVIGQARDYEATPEIDSIAMMETFKGCNVVEGNLVIKYHMGQSNLNPEKLVEYFGDIQVITGFFQVFYTQSFISLRAFQNLTEIRGETLYQGRYAVAIFDNENLHSLFSENNTGLTIGRGNIYFHDNKNLCYSVIKSFSENINLKENVTDLDVSKNTNGERGICEEQTIKVFVSPTNMNAMIQYDRFDTKDTDHRKFRGYNIYYRQVDHRDPKLDIYANRSACTDSWNIMFVPHDENNSNENVTTMAQANIHNLLPYTDYALYIETKVIAHMGAVKAISKVEFFRTLPSEPGPIIFLKTDRVSPHEVYFKWKAPLKPNGKLAYYEISWKLLPESLTEFAHDPCGQPMPLQEKKTAFETKKVSKSEGKNKEKTCKAIQGCCTCKESDEGSEKINPYSEEANQNRIFEEDAIIENNIQNQIFVQRNERPHPASKEFINAIRQKRSINGTVQAKDTAILNDLTDDEEALELSNGSGIIPDNQEMLITSTKGTDVSLNDTDLFLNTTDLFLNEYSISGNVTVSANDTLELYLKNLTHFGRYLIIINACIEGDYEEPPSHFCSNTDAHVYIRTLPDLTADLINPKKIRAMPNDTITDLTTESSIYWEPPTHTNGILLGYKYHLINNATNQTVQKDCVSAKKIESNELNGTNGPRLTFSALANGEYVIHIQTITQFGTSKMVESQILFVVAVKGFWNLQTGSLLVLIILIIVAAACGIGWLIFNKKIGDKVEEIARQTISSNPEYLSQYDVYQIDEWELKREDIVLGDKIGSGTFGEVMKAFANNIISHCGSKFGHCAVKTVRTDASPSERLHFLFEASIMKGFSAPFIVKLYGVVSEGQPVLVVMELMGKGNLRDFLREHRPDAEENVENRPVPTNQQYCNWAAQICDGMAYLENSKFCHRDLAARNIMCNDDEMLKIGDFGMARDVYYHEYYQPTGKRLIPVRWMSPESLRDGKFSTKSDVWSFGVVLYEMLTLAQQPYAGLDNSEVFHYISAARRILKRPGDCPNFWYNIMTSCWRYNPSDRPTFYQILNHLQPYTTDEFKQQSFVMNNYDKFANVAKTYNFDSSVPSGGESEIEDNENDDDALVSRPYFPDGESGYAGTDSNYVFQGNTKNRKKLAEANGIELEAMNTKKNEDEDEYLKTDRGHIARIL